METLGIILLVTPFIIADLWALHAVLKWTYQDGDPFGLVAWVCLNSLMIGGIIAIVATS